MQSPNPMETYHLLLGKRSKISPSGLPVKKLQLLPNKVEENPSTYADQFKLIKLVHEHFKPGALEKSTRLGELVPELKEKSETTGLEENEERLLTLVKLANQPDSFLPGLEECAEITPKGFARVIGWRLDTLSTALELPSTEARVVQLNEQLVNIKKIERYVKLMERLEKLQATLTKLTDELNGAEGTLVAVMMKTGLGIPEEEFETIMGNAATDDSSDEE